MDSINSKLLFEQVSDAEQKFDYFITGLVGALCGYIGKSYVATKIGFNASTIEIISILILVCSFCFAVGLLAIRIKFKNANGDYLYVIDAKKKLIQESKYGMPQDPEINMIRNDLTGSVIPIGTVPILLSEMDALISAYSGRMCRWHKKARVVSVARFVFLVVGFLTLLVAKVVKPYIG